MLLLSYFLMEEDCHEIATVYVCGPAIMLIYYYLLSMHKKPEEPRCQTGTDRKSSC